MKDKLGVVKLKIVEMDIPFNSCDRSWFYLKHIKSLSNYDFRWCIGWRKRDNWIGLICMFPATHEIAIDMIKTEIELAKLAIKEIKKGITPKS